MRRERQRKNSERQRVNSTSTLAASVGLPCPFTSSGTQDGGSTDWQASERLSQANLDAITFPGILQTGDGSAGNSESLVTDRQMRQSLSDASILEYTSKDINREKAFSLDMRGIHAAENTERLSPVTPAPMLQPTVPQNRKHSESPIPSTPPSSKPDIQQHHSSLRISESIFFSSVNQQQPFETGLLQEDYDEVFFQNPTPPPPPSPIKETCIMEDLPLPPPPTPFELDQEIGNETVGRFVVCLLCIVCSYLYPNLNIVIVISKQHHHSYQEVIVPFPFNISLFLYLPFTQSPSFREATDNQCHLHNNNPLGRGQPRSWVPTPS